MRKENDTMQIVHSITQNSVPKEHRTSPVRTETLVGKNRKDLFLGEVELVSLVAMSTGEIHAGSSVLRDAIVAIKTVELGVNRCAVKIMKS